MGLSAVCAYSLATVEAVFSRGKYMQSATVEQSHTKWVRYNGPVPTPRPGAVSRVPSSREGLSSLWVSGPKHETAEIPELPCSWLHGNRSLCTGPSGCRAWGCRVKRVPFLISST